MAPKLPNTNFATLPVGAKIFMLVVALLLVGTGYYLGVHMQLEEETQDAVRRHDSLNNELNEARERQKQYLKLREEMASRDALDHQNLRILPDTTEMPAFLDDLNRLAELSGLRVISVGPRPEKAEQFYVRVPVALMLKGKYHQLAKFFYNISRLERAINMENIALAGAEKDGEDINLSVQVLATTFRRPDGAKGK
jgi:type IV pilus assembly protein PilO